MVNSDSVVVRPSEYFGCVDDAEIFVDGAVENESDDDALVACVGLFLVAGVGSVKLAPSLFVVVARVLIPALVDVDAISVLKALEGNV